MAETKDPVSHVELDPAYTKYGVSPEEAEVAQALRDYVPDTEAEKKLVRKIDMRLIPVLWVMYVLNYVDRTNIVCCFVLRPHNAPHLVLTSLQGNAKIAGMAKDLALDDQRMLIKRHLF